jgi:hypothetical protein
MPPWVARQGETPDVYDSPMRYTAQGSETISGADGVSRDRLLYELEASRKKRPLSPVQFAPYISTTDSEALHSFLGVDKSDVGTPMAFAHIIPNGTYFVQVTRTKQTGIQWAHQPTGVKRNEIRDG